MGKRSSEERELNQLADEFGEEKRFSAQPMQSSRDAEISLGAVIGQAPKSFGGGRVCRWKGCGCRLTLYNEGAVMRGMERRVLHAAPDGAPVGLCFRHQKEANERRFDFERTRPFLEWLQSQLKPAENSPLHAA